MKRRILIDLVLTLSSTVVAAEVTETAQEDYCHCENGAYFSGTYGGGIGGTAGGTEDVQWAFEIRFGKEFSDEHNLRWDIIHLNEGHPETLGHRDGFGGQAVWSFGADSRLSAELGVGAIFTLNSLEVDGQKEDEKNAGVLATVVLLYRFGRNGYHIRAQVEHLEVHSSHYGDLYLIGLGKKFPDFSDQPSSGKVTYLNALIGGSITNSGGTEAAINATLEVSRLLGRNFAVSAVILDQGDDQVRSDRKAVGSQVSRLIPLNEKWTMSAGAGLLMGTDDRNDESDLELYGLFTLRGERRLGEDGNRRLYLDFTRLFSEGDLEPDGDLFRLGIGWKIGGH